MDSIPRCLKSKPDLPIFRQLEVLPPQENSFSSGVFHRQNAERLSIRFLRFAACSVILEP
nr:MAG TPA: hypothetical protein [Caudoviricetes sp.]